MNSKTKNPVWAQYAKQRTKLTGLALNSHFHEHEIEKILYDACDFGARHRVFVRHTDQQPEPNQQVLLKEPDGRLSVRIYRAGKTDGFGLGPRYLDQQSGRWTFSDDYMWSQL